VSSNSQSGHSKSWPFLSLVWMLGFSLQSVWLLARFPSFWLEVKCVRNWVDEPLVWDSMSLCLGVRVFFYFLWLSASEANISSRVLIIVSLVVFSLPWDSVNEVCVSSDFSLSQAAQGSVLGVCVIGSSLPRFYLELSSVKGLSLQGKPC
jgi:hypothetical protein